MTEIKKVVIPKFVGEFISDAIGNNPTPWGKTDMIRNIDLCLDKSKCQKLVEWSNLLGNFITLIEAILYGYEIEKEKLYYVSLPYLGFMTNSFDFPLTKVKEDGAKSTEQEIKSIDERYWAFAVEVEG